MASRIDPYAEAQEHVITFLVSSQLPWSSFEETFETLQDVVVNTLTFPTSKAILVVLIRNIYAAYVRTKNQRKGSWERFYRKVFSTLDKERQLPEGVRWEKVGKSDWRLVKDVTPADTLGDLLVKTERNKKDEWECDRAHPLVMQGLTLGRDAELVPKVHRKVNVTIKAISCSAYAVVMEFVVPLRQGDNGFDNMGRKYIDESVAETIVRRLLPRTSHASIEKTRHRELVRNKSSYVERLNVIVKV